MLFPSTPDGTPEEPRSVQERPGRAPRASKNHPPRALGGPLGIQKVSRRGVGSPGASCWSSQEQFYLIFHTFPELLFSRLLSLFSSVFFLSSLLYAILFTVSSLCLIALFLLILSSPFSRLSRDPPPPPWCTNNKKKEGSAAWGASLVNEIKTIYSNTLIQSNTNLSIKTY